MAVRESQLAHFFYRKRYLHSAVVFFNGETVCDFQTFSYICANNNNLNIYLWQQRN